MSKIMKEKVCTVGGGNARHDVRGEWSYVRSNRSTCGRPALGVEHLMSGKPLEVTCGSCVRILRARGE